MTQYIRLSALDRSFLDSEGANTPLHVGACCLFEAAPLRSPTGGIDVDRIRQLVASRLHAIPTYRRKIFRTPFEGHPVWIDDCDFSVNYHVRHIGLPRPGAIRQLKRLAGRIFSQHLDHAKPLWELWVVEGIEDDRFALISKVHYSMFDGFGGGDLLAELLADHPTEEIDVPQPWEPQIPPSTEDLLSGALWARVGNPLNEAAVWATRAIEAPNTAVAEVKEVAAGVGEAVARGVRPASGSPLNEAVGAHRRFDWSETPLESILQIARTTRTTVNDVVLTVVAGGVAHFFENRGFVRAQDPEFCFKVFCPVGLGEDSASFGIGNRVSAFSVELPLALGDPLRSLELIHDRTSEARESGAAEGIEAIEAFADLVAPSLIGWVDRLATRVLPFNLLVTNFRGPAKPFYLLGAKMLAGYPSTPLFEYQGLSVALMSYDGVLSWGFSADRDSIPDLHDFMLAIDDSFKGLYAAAMELGDASVGSSGSGADRARNEEGSSPP